MPCYFPNQVLFPSTGRPIFKGSPYFNKEQDYHPSGYLPCGTCEGCRLKQANDWTIRMVHTSKMYNDSCFLTLTYDDDNLPPSRDLSKVDLSCFLKSLKKKLRRNFGITDVSYFACGEYGERGTERPHYHVCLFGFDFPDKYSADLSVRKNPQFQSDFLDECWHRGRARIGNFSASSAKYTAMYMQKAKSDGKAVARRVFDPSTGDFRDRNPEFRTSSKSLGLSFLKKFFSDIFPSDEVVLANPGKEASVYKAPFYYLRKLKELSVDLYNAVKAKRLTFVKPPDFEELRRKFRCKMLHLSKNSRTSDPMPVPLLVGLDAPWRAIFGDLLSS